MNTSSTSKKAGRPDSSSDNARDSILQCARDIFVVMPYDKASVRLICNKAGVNYSLVSYYFGNKEGLFIAVIQEAVDQTKQRLRELTNNPSHSTLIDFIRGTYQELICTPHLLKLIGQCLRLPPEDNKRKRVEEPRTQ